MIPTDEIYMTPVEFAQMMKISVYTVLRRCRSKPWRTNRIARKEGGVWRIDFNRYKKWWAGELK